MSLIARLAAGPLFLLPVLAAMAAEPPAPAPRAASAPAEAVARRTVIEDEGARIEETRLRGAPQRIVVQSKLLPVAPYEIIVGPNGRDAAQQRGATGQTAWSVLSF
ncbi:conserved exported hypothetical protein [Rubrivivax sp. A210]|uniref:hypothetical protein n=1 Tax=Rubrivivax sp. A210 TaxID=2772301 RepID=UPI001918C17C|nr:hypothetical protein [Rubrivivax sp. A210]CAD5373779.1 conserved exported hypothetical protein [Rubrivivax sp. A210]